MSISVYPRLAALLKEQDLSVADLARQIEQRFGLALDHAGLERLVRAEPMQDADLELAAAAALVLGLDLGPLFTIDAAADPAHPATAAGTMGAPLLELAQSCRLAELLELEDRAPLTAAQRGELRDLVAEYGRRLDEAGIRTYAEQRHLSVEDARHELEASFDAMVAQERQRLADPRWRRRVRAEIERRRPSPLA